MNINKILLVSNVILILAVGTLFVLFFSDNKTSHTGSENIPLIDSLKNENIEVSDFRIAYINVDSLLANYKYYTKLEDELAVSKKKKQAQMEYAMNAFQKDYEKFVKKAQRGDFLTQASAQSAEQDLLRRQQELQQMEVNSQEQLMKEQELLFRKLNDTIVNYLKSYNKNKYYQYVVGTDGGLLYANKSYNITDTVLSALNSRYKNDSADNAEK